MGRAPRGSPQKLSLHLSQPVSTNRQPMWPGWKAWAHNLLQSPAAQHSWCPAAQIHSQVSKAPALTDGWQQHPIILTIGSNGFFSEGGARAAFNQQPVEACKFISACLDASRVSGEVRWIEHAVRAFDWFLGQNELQRPIYDPATGAVTTACTPTGSTPIRGRSRRSRSCSRCSRCVRSTRR